MLRFALVLKECEHIRAQKMEDETEGEAAASADGGGGEPFAATASGGCSPWP